MSWVTSWSDDECQEEPQRNASINLVRWEARLNIPCLLQNKHHSAEAGITRAWRGPDFREATGTFCVHPSNFVFRKEIVKNTHENYFANKTLERVITTKVLTVKMVNFFRCFPLKSLNTLVLCLSLSSNLNSHVSLPSNRAKLFFRVDRAARS